MKRQGGRVHGLDEKLGSVGWCLFFNLIGDTPSQNQEERAFPVVSE